MMEGGRNQRLMKVREGIYSRILKGTLEDEREGFRDGWNDVMKELLPSCFGIIDSTLCSLESKTLVLQYLCNLIWKHKYR